MFNIRQAAKIAMHNKKDLSQTKTCGCFHCMAIFEPKEIKEWTDKEEDTAVCPFCYNDTVLPEGNDLHLNREILDKINNYWLKRK